MSRPAIDAYVKLVEQARGMLHNPFYYWFLESNVDSQPCLKPQLQSSDLPFNFSNCSFHEAIGLWVVCWRVARHCYHRRSFLLDRSLYLQDGWLSVRDEGYPCVTQIFNGDGDIVHHVLVFCTFAFHFAT